MRFRLVLLLVIFTIMACAAQRVRTSPPTKSGPGWVSVEQPDGTILIVAGSEAAAEAGVKEICSHSYVCQIDKAAARYVTRRRK